MVKNAVHSEFVRSLEISAIFRTNLQELQVKTGFIVLTADYVNTARVTELSWTPTDLLFE